MAPHTVAIQAHTGRIGKHALAKLLEAHKAGEIKLVVVCRPGSDTSMIPKDVEVRELDLTKPDHEKIKAAFKGVNTLASMVAIPALGEQTPIFKALAETAGVVTYISPGLGNPKWLNEGPVYDERLTGFLALVDPILKAPREAGLGITKVQTSVFTDYFLGEFNYLETDFKNNVLCLPTGAEKMPLPLVTPAALGASIAEVAMRAPESIKDKTFHVYDLEPTGEEIIQTFAKLHGSQPKIVEYDDAAYERDMSSEGPAISPAVYRHDWRFGTWGWEGERLGPRKQVFVAVAKTYLSK